MTDLKVQRALEEVVYKSPIKQVLTSITRVESTISHMNQLFTNSTIIHWLARKFNP